MNHSTNSWDTRRDREMRQTLIELRLMDEGGYFEGLQAVTSIPEDLKVQAAISAQLNKGAPFMRKIAQLRPMDLPVGPALTQFMNQVSIRDRTETYKTETHRKFEDAVAQVRILFEKIVRGEIASNAIVRSIVSSFMDTFMNDRNLLLNLAASPHTGQNY
nr:hypothetical protein [Fibrobacterota bacterium]